MSTCDDGLMVVLPLTLLLVLPVAVPLVGFAWVAWRRGSRAASLGHGLVALVLLLLSLALAPRLGGPLRLLPLAVLPVVACAALALWKPMRGTRLAALVASAVPPLALQAWVVRQALVTDCGLP